MNKSELKEQLIISIAPAVTKEFIRNLFVRTFSFNKKNLKIEELKGMANDVTKITLEIADKMATEFENETGRKEV